MDKQDRWVTVLEILANALVIILVVMAFLLSSCVGSDERAPAPDAGAGVDATAPVPGCSLCGVVPMGSVTCDGDGACACSTPNGQRFTCAGGL